MTDRELLELSAKAAGYEIKYGEPKFPGVIYLMQGTEGGAWNPLTDDGDALRLAVKLGLIINIWNEAKKVFAGYGVSEEGIIEPITNNPYAATRRAIVRAAAAIGKEQP